jgi:hypothetical protein
MTGRILGVGKHCSIVEETQRENIFETLLITIINCHAGSSKKLTPNQ